MIGEYLANGMVTVCVLMGLYLLLVLPAARVGFINEHSSCGDPRHSVVASALLWMVVCFWAAVIVLGLLVTELLVPLL